MKKYVFLLLILSACSVSAKETWFDLKLSKGTIFQNVVLKKIKGDTLICEHENNEIGINIVELDKIYKIRPSNFWKSAGIGLIGGAVTGGIIGRASYKKPESDGYFTIDFGPGFSTLGGAILGGGTGFLVGGIVSVSKKGSKKEYDLSKLALEHKKIIIDAIMNAKM